MSERIGVINGPLKRKVAIRHDGEDFVIAFLPDETVVFRHAEARALRKACLLLRWEVVSDTIAEPNNLASW
jgi:hypothetical protein